MLNLYAIVRILGIFIIISSFAAIEILAQIAITQGDFEQSLQKDYEITQSLSTDTENIESLVDLNGPDQEWDFTTLELDETVTGNYEIIEDAEGLPGGDDSHFADATHVGILPFSSEAFADEFADIKESYVYFQLDEGEAITLGAVYITETDDEDETNYVYFNPGQIKYVFPVEYGNTWEYDFELEAIFEDTPVAPIGFEVDVEVDGWGELTTSEGILDVLRVRKAQTMDVFGTETVEYEFYDSDGLLVAIISDSGSGELEASINSYTAVSTSSEEGNELAHEFSLDQNYPNPFNPSTNITFDLPVNTTVTLAVYDVLGREVSMLLNDQQFNSGSYIVSFDGTTLSSGIYLYRLQAGEQVLSNKMILSK